MSTLQTIMIEIVSSIFQDHPLKPLCIKPHNIFEEILFSINKIKSTDQSQQLLHETLSA